MANLYQRLSLSKRQHQYHERYSLNDGKGHKRRRSKGFFERLFWRRKSLSYLLFIVTIVMLARWWVFCLLRVEKIHQEEIQHQDQDITNAINIGVDPMKKPDEPEMKNDAKNSITDKKLKKMITFDTTANTNVNAKTTRQKFKVGKRIRPLTSRGEREIKESIQTAVSNHDKSVRQKKHWIMRSFLDYFFPHNVMYFSSNEKKQLNETIMDLIVDNPRYRMKKGSLGLGLKGTWAGKLMVGDKAVASVGDIKNGLSDREKEDITVEIERINQYHTSKGAFDSCRGVYWNEVTIHIQGLCSVNDNTDASNNDAAANGGMDVRNLEEVQAQMKAIVKNISPYLPQMVREGSMYRTVLFIPNALCFGNKLNTHATRQENSITLTTHMGVGKYQRFLVLLQRWNGPISIAIKIRNVDEIRNFHLFVLEHLILLDNVRFHYYVEHAPEYELAYPQNILRNLAITHISTELFLVNDVDIFPSPMNTHDKLRDAIEKNSEIQKGLGGDTLYIVPMFDFNQFVPDNELKFDYSGFPNSKEDTVRMNATGIISQHLMVQHPKGHRAVEYEKWFRNDTGTSYDIAFENKFEPYVIGSRMRLTSTGEKEKRDLPLFYPYYRGYGFDKYSWYAELSWAGYHFEVMRDFFLFHVKHDSSYGDMDEKREFLEINRICSRGFLRYILEKYGSQDGNSVWNEWIEEVYMKPRKTWLE